MQTSDMTHEEMLFYSGMLGGYLYNEGIRAEPLVKDGLYTGELEIEVSNDLYITIKAIGVRNAQT